MLHFVTWGGGGWGDPRAELPVCDMGQRGCAAQPGLPAPLAPGTGPA